MFKKVFAFALMVAFAIFFAIVVIEATPGYADMGCDPTTEYVTPVGCMPLENLDRPNGLTGVTPRDGTVLGAVWGALQVWGDEVGYGSPQNLYLVDAPGGRYEYSDMSIYLGPDVLDSYGDIGLWYVLGHEYGHYVQQVTEIADPDSIESELHADSVSGAFVRWALDQGLVSASDVETIYNTFLSWDGTENNHGTSDQRTDAFTSGYNNPNNV